jgi:LemA protein
MKALSVVVGIIVLLLVIGLGAGCSSYKQAVTLDVAAQSQWSQIDVQLQRRYDLIPNLVETVKGYAAHEKGVFDDIANSRAAYAQAKTPNDQARAAGQVESALGRLLAISEAYPNLKANEGFLKLQDQLEGTENRLSVERLRYNDAVRALNTFIRTPYGMFGNLFAHVRPREFFQTPESARAVPKVSFGAPAPAAQPAPATP